ncbi:MAG TPA: dihydroorotase [Candidatus Eisenbergiella merdigallinarum]|uniref:Dihydroorotase n=1 Tax=Candidatus Eisenbergiella merdigallinarum TaxID=2838552 RepID=A0A9D2MRS5_9FIRM|nr:dihydroorotase [Candidatus Eisenbergiella merdigallinarum]
MLLIRNCHLIDPASGTDGRRDILVEGEKIRSVARPGELSLSEEGGRVIDADGLIAAPGLVDTHVHFRDPGAEYKEDIFTGAETAAAGGVTSVVLMANTSPHVDNEDTLRYVIEKGKKTGIRVYTCANVTMDMDGDELTDMDGLLKAGAVGFTDDGKPLLNEGIARKAMQEAARLHAPISFHEEDPACIANNGINAGKASAFFGIGGSDRRAEISMVQRDLSMALETGARIVIQHISAREAVELVRQARKKSGRIHAEATPHHFSLNEEAAIEYGTMAKMNPPLREEADRQAIVAGLADGTIDLIATDHAPHSAEEKAKPITEAPSGIIGLETSLSLGIMNLVHTGALTMERLLACMTVNPAGLYGLDAGRIYEGGPADLILFDENEEWVPEKFRSKSQNSPFLGQKLTGKVKLTVCRGRIVYEDQKDL